jgi:hypothetical protein
LDESRRDHERTLDEFRHLLSQMEDSLPTATLRFGVRYEELVLQWIEEVAHSVGESLPPSTTRRPRPRPSSTSSLT